MAIRKNTNPRATDLQPGLRDILLRNGMQAHVVMDGGSYKLLVQGHESPLLSYTLTDRQVQALTDWGTNYADKKAYRTFTDIVGGDFYLPRSFVHARNANGRVAMGLHGYRIGTGEYGRTGWPPPFLGWTPRQQGGWHMRRIGGAMFFPGAPMFPERPDGRLKPGELQSGGYGFYYKGTSRQAAVPGRDVLQDLEAVITPTETRPRSTEPAKPYKELVTSPVYFSNEKWQECLASHGLVIDTEKKTLTVQSEKVAADMVYDLTDEELAVLTSNSLKEHSLEQRLETLNGVIQSDFASAVTTDMLNGKERIAIDLKPEVRQEIEAMQAQQDEAETRAQQAQAPDGYSVEAEVSREGASVYGDDLAYLNEDKGWFREGRHGREVSVGEIRVEPTETEGKYRMTAVIDGERVSHEITQKDYDKFLAVDDYHRMKLFSKIFGEVDMKSRIGLGAKIGGALLAGVAVMGELAHDAHHHPHHAPAVFVDRFGPPPPRPYFKPGVDSPMDVAARNFEAAMNAENRDMHLGNGR